VRGEVLGRLDACREGLSAQRSVYGGAEEPDKGAGFGERHVPERCPRGEHAAGGRVAQEDEIGQPSGLVRDNGPGDLDHLHERGSAFLHARTAGGGRGDNRQPFPGGSPDGGGDARRGRAADRAAEEAELADYDGGRLPVH
jgi:hypothetical protein